MRKIRGGRYHNQDFMNADLRNIDWADMDLTGSDFRGADLRGAKIRYCNITNCKFEGSNRITCDFTGCWDRERILLRNRKISRNFEGA